MDLLVLSSTLGLKSIQLYLSLLLFDCVFSVFSLVCGLCLWLF